MIGDEIRRLAAVKGLTTQQQIADAAGLSRSFVTRLLSGSRPNLTADVLFKISAALSVDCNHWKQFFEQPAPKPTRKRKTS